MYFFDIHVFTAPLIDQSESPLLIARAKLRRPPSCGAGYLIRRRGRSMRCSKNQTVIATPGVLSRASGSLDLPVEPQYHLSIKGESDPVS